MISPRIAKPFAIPKTVTHVFCNVQSDGRFSPIGGKRAIFTNEFSPKLPENLPSQRLSQIWGCAKGAAKRACGKTVVQTPKNGQQQALNQNPQLDSPEKIHTFWIKATCDSRFCVLDAYEQKANSLEFTDGLPRHGPSDWDKATKHEKSVFRFSQNSLEQNTRTPMKTRMDSSKHSEVICVRDAGRTRNFLGQSFRTKNVLSKTCQWTLQTPCWTLRFARGLSALRKNAFLEKISALQPTTLEAPKCVVTVLAKFLLLPSLPWAYVSLQLSGGFCYGL